jgi:N-acetylmuramic acid 6-phosphate etherase
VLGADDVAIGVSASGRTPFTTVALETARRNGALTIGIANTPRSPLLDACDYPVLIETGPEPIGGSTRLHAGTAQKIALNLFSTLLMIRLGRVYGGMMVSMRATNEKLKRRGERIVMTIGGVEREAAAAALTQAGNDIKLAALIALGVQHADAEALLARHAGDLRNALKECGSAAP